MAKLIFEQSGEESEINDGSSILDICEEMGVPFACTEGCCGTCVIEVTDGMDNLSDFCQIEEEFFGEQSSKDRLACQCKILKGTVTINS